MAKIPEYDIQVSQDTQPTVKVNPNDLTSAAQGGTEMINTVNQINQDFYNLRILKEKTKATTDLKIAMSQIEQEAVNDPDNSPQRLDEYNQRLQETIDTHLNTISDQTAREQARLGFELEGQSANSKISTTFKAKEIETQQYETYEALNVLKNTYITSEEGSLEKQKAWDDAIFLLSDNVSGGVLTSEKAAQYRESMRKDWNLEQAYYDARIDKALYDEKRARGAYEDLTEQELAKVDLYATNVRKKTMDEFKIRISQAQIETSKDLFDKAENKKLTLEEIDRAEALGEMSVDGGISAKQADVLRQMISTRKQPVNTRLAEYSKLSSGSDQFFDEEGNVLTDDIEGTLKKVNAYKDKIIQSAGEGRLNESDAKSLLNDMNIVVNSLFDQKATDTVFKQHRIATFFFRNSWENKYSKDIEAERGRLLQEYNRSLQEGKEPEEAKQEAINKINIEINPNRTKYKVGETYKMPAGLLRVKEYDDNGDPVFERAK